MRIAIITAGVVSNVILAASIEAAPLEAGDIAIAAASGVGPGWTYDGTTFHAPPAAPEPVPECVEMWQARAALKLAGYYEAADAAITASGNAALIEAWTNGNHFTRASSAIAALSAMLGLSAAQVDGLFRSAASIQV